MSRLALVLLLAACHAANTPATSPTVHAALVVAPTTPPLRRTLDFGARGSLTLGQVRALAGGHVERGDPGVTICDGRCPDTLVAFDPPLPESTAAMFASLDAAGRVTSVVGLYYPAPPISTARDAWEARLGVAPCFVSPRELWWRDASTLVRIIGDTAGVAQFWVMADMTRADLIRTTGYTCP